MENLKDIEELLLKNKFEVIELENVSLDFQIELFSQTKKVVSPSGAALTNMIFCPPKTQIFAFMSDHRLSNFYLWSQLADTFDLEMKIITGERLFNLTNYYEVHDDYLVDLELINNNIIDFTEKTTGQ